MEKEKIYELLVRAKRYYSGNAYGLSGMCCAISEVAETMNLITPYRSYQPVYNLIPEFNPAFLKGVKEDIIGYWWKISDIKSRLEAFDKLISIYDPGFEISSCFLRDNSPEIRKILKEKGFSLCPCTEYEDSVFLDYTPSIKSIHGGGFSDETMPIKDPVAYFLEGKDDHDIDCGKDLDTFIKLCKRLKKQENDSDPLIED